MFKKVLIVVLLPLLVSNAFGYSDEIFHPGIGNAVFFETITTIPNAGDTLVLRHDNRGVMGDIRFTCPVVFCGNYSYPRQAKTIFEAGVSFAASSDEYLLEINNCGEVLRLIGNNQKARGVIVFNCPVTIAGSEAFPSNVLMTFASGVTLETGGIYYVSRGMLAKDELEAFKKSDKLTLNDVVWAKLFEMCKKRNDFIMDNGNRVSGYISCDGYPVPQRSTFNDILECIACDRETDDLRRIIDYILKKNEEDSGRTARYTRKDATLLYAAAITYYSPSDPVPCSSEEKKLTGFAVRMPEDAELIVGDGAVCSLVGNFGAGKFTVSCGGCGEI